MNKINLLKRKLFRNDIIIIVIIVTLPFLFFIYNLAPEKGPYWKTFIFTIYAGIYEDIDYYLWSLSTKIFTILIITVWYVTCRHWWRFILFFPLSIDLNNLYIILNFRYSFFEQYNFLYLLPLTIIYIVLLLIISLKLEYYPSNNSLSRQLNREIATILDNISNFKKEDFKTLKFKFVKLRKSKSTMDKKEYLARLIELRDSISVK